MFYYPTLISHSLQGAALTLTFPNPTGQGLLPTFPIPQDVRRTDIADKNLLALCDIPNCL